MLDVTAGLDDDVHCTRCGATRFWHEGDLTYCDGFVVPSWDYREPTRIDDIDALLARVARELGMGKAEDDAAELAKIQAQQEANSKLLFESLKREQREAEQAKEQGKK